MVDYNKKTGGCTFCGALGRVWVWGKDATESVVLCDPCKVALDGMHEKARQAEEVPA